MSRQHSPAYSYYEEFDAVQWRRKQARLFINLDKQKREKKKVFGYGYSMSFFAKKVLGGGELGPLIRRRLCSYLHLVQLLKLFNLLTIMINERKSKQAHIPHAPSLLENSTHNEWQDMHHKII